ncbi:bifunctional DNA primase/polymerase [Pseudonocardia sp. ICBG162]|uniref:bifunctional DNA primase/polymerase n=1 Tax=Pseudonocardia sp. ICBG162 TaxID=2846761 RepID=UPI001CF6C29D|nr:bifunctional DNA primase/polymerase [Pseudonocardia sp. ICBG162]
MSGHTDLLGFTRVFGVHMGNGFVGIDVDADRGGSLDGLEAEYGPLPPTLTTVTPSGPQNLHLVFRTSGSVCTSKELTKRFPGVDFIGAGGHLIGASSVRLMDTKEEVAYKAQWPFLDPAPLPEGLERAWRATAPASVDSLRSDEIESRVFDDSVLPELEADTLDGVIMSALDVIRSTNGPRHDTTLRMAVKVYHAALLRGEPLDSYDDQIRDAYEDSGGEDFPDLAKMIRDTKAYAVTNPRPRPAVSAYVKTRRDEIGLWADAATAAFPTKAKNIRALITAVAVEATTEFNMSTSASTLADRYPGVGSRSKVSRNLGVLESNGLLYSDGGAWTLSGWYTPHWTLREP